MKILFLFMLASLVSACASGQDQLDKSKHDYEDSINKQLQGWMGHSVKEMVTAWGVPTNTFKAPDGTTLYEYSFNRNDGISNTTYNQYTGFNTTQFSHFCKTTFTVDTTNRLSNFRWNGNSCRGPNPPN